MTRDRRPPSRAPGAGTLALASLPFLIRLAYMIETSSQPYLRWNMLVGYVNHHFAADLATGQGAPYALFRSPFYPLLVSLVYRVSGVAPLAVLSIQWLLGACGCLLVADIASRLVGRTAGHLALVIGALYVPAVFFEGEILEQSAATFCLVAAVWVMVRFGASREGPAAPAAAALLYGLAFLMRPDLLLAFPLLAAGILAIPASARRRATRLGVFCSGCIVMLWLLAHPGLFMEVSASHLDINGAINLYLGNNEEATGIDPRFPDTDELDTADPDARRDHMTGLDLAGIRHALARTGGDLSAVAPYWLGRTREFVKDDPAACARLAARKGLLFFSGFINSNQKDIYFARSLSIVLAALVFCAGICFPLGLIIPLAIVGATGPLPRHARILLLAVPAGCLLTTLAFFHDVRFQYPAVPFMIVLAAAGAVRLARAVRERRWMPAVILVPALLVSNVDTLGTHQVRLAAESFRMGTMHEEAGDDAAARQAYFRSIEAEPGYRPALDNLVTLSVRDGALDDSIRFLEKMEAGGRRDARLITSLATLYEMRGRVEEAVAALRDGLRRDPSDPVLALALATALMRQGRCAEALPLYRDLMNGAGEPDAFAGAGYCLSSLGDDGRAASALRQGLALFPVDVPLLGLLGQVEGRLGRRADERARYGEILRIDPGNAGAMIGMARSLAADGRPGEAIVWAGRARDLGHPEAGALIEMLERGGRAP